MFSNETQKGDGSGWEARGEELGEVEVGETGIRVYYVRKKAISPLLGGGDEKASLPGVVVHVSDLRIQKEGRRVSVVQKAFLDY